MKKNLLVTIIGIPGYLITLFIWLGLLFVALFSLLNLVSPRTLLPSAVTSMPTASSQAVSLPLTVLLATLGLVLAAIGAYQVSVYLIRFLNYLARIIKHGFWLTRTLALLLGGSLLVMGLVSFTNTSVGSGSAALAALTGIAASIAFANFCLDWLVAGWLRVELGVMVRTTGKNRKPTV